MNPSLTRIQKQIVLVGAGNAHLVFIRKWLMRPLPGVQVTLVNPSRRIPYSAMVPAFLAGEYSEDEIMIDLVKLCALAKVRLIATNAERIDIDNHIVELPNRPALRWDLLSINVGTVPKPLGYGNFLTIPLRPLNQLIEKIDELSQRAKSSTIPLKLLVVGGGASGCELAIAIHRRLGENVSIHLIQSGYLHPVSREQSRHYFAKQFARRGITWQIGNRVLNSDANGLILKDGTHIRCDAVLWANIGAPIDLIEKSGLITNSYGFIHVNEYLQTKSDKSIFAAGDCIVLSLQPNLKKDGVHAVRQGSVLFDNIIRTLKSRPLNPYKPRRNNLYLLNSGDGDAVLDYGWFNWKSSWARKLKDRIDRRWMKKMSPEPMREPEPQSDIEVSMQCGGCGSKVSADVLGNVLQQLTIEKSKNVVLGTTDGEDAAAIRLRDGTLQIQTIDYFKTFTDDPFLFGKVAALNSLSDLFAMNAKPETAMAMATLPHARGPIQESMLLEMLSGAEGVLRQHDVTLIGGHTVEGAELALGFSISGSGDEATLFRKNALQAGDKLILTKPLGSGALLAAWMRGQCRAEWYDVLVEDMLLSNADASRILARHGVRAVTDITGFGLAGHLLEMLDASHVSATIDKALTLPGFDEVIALGARSTMHAKNAKVASRINGTQPAWLFDPRTAGGLLAGVPATDAETIVQELCDAGYIQAGIIGECHADASRQIVVDRSAIKC